MSKKKLSVGQIVKGVCIGILGLAVLAFAGVGIYSTVKYVQDNKQPAEEQTETDPAEDEVVATSALTNYVEAIEQA